MPRDRRGRLRLALRGALCLIYAAAGLAHLLTPAPFLAITPDWVPFPDHVVRLTGLAELAGSIGLLTPRLRRAAGWGLAAYAAAVWPANFKHALEGIEIAGLPTGWLYHAPRLALQPLLIWAALYAGDIVDWPFANKGRHR